MVEVELNDRDNDDDFAQKICSFCRVPSGDVRPSFQFGCVKEVIG